MLKKKQLFDCGENNAITCPISKEEIQRIIPQRHPFLFLDSINYINLENRELKATRFIDESDPIFRGHFPGNPIYPGSLQQEAMFQGCLALLYFVVNNQAHVPESSDVINAVATRLYDMEIVDSVRPGDAMSLYCHIEEYDDLLTTAVAQVWVGDRLCSVARGEFYVM